MHIETFARNPYYHEYGGIGYGFCLRYATLSFSTNDGADYTEFYRFGVDEAGTLIISENLNGYTSSYGAYTTPKSDEIKTFDLTINN